MSSLVNLMTGVSGVRGIVGRSLTPELLTRLGAAFGTYMKAGHIVIGRDTRTSGDMVKYSVFSGLLSTGCNITDIDISTTPSCQIMIEELGADGGIVISASHNPIEWNALKLFKANGMYLNKEESKEFFDIYHKGNFLKAEWNQLKDLETDVSTVRRHLKKVLKHIDIEKIRRRKFKVALDSCNGAGSTITPILLEKLGCQVVSIHCLPNGLFPHNPEPIFINLGDLSKLVKKTKADIGFAQDADADRVAIITEKGQILSEEYSLSMTTQYRLSQKKGTVVVNLSTSRAIDDIADSYGVPVIRTAVGEINVAEKLKEVNGVIGGEGNGGVIDPRVHYGRDSLAGIVIMLEYLACEKEPISKLAGRIPKYYSVKLKTDCPVSRSAKVMRGLRDMFKKEKIDFTEGMKVSFDHSWVHIRPSGTEPVIRVIAESQHKKEASDLANKVLKEVKKQIKS